MALLFADSFDHYVNADITQKWTQVPANNDGGNSALSSAAGRRSTTGWRASRAAGGGSFAGSSLNKTLTVGDTTCLLGFAFRFNGAFASQTLTTSLVYNSPQTAAICAIHYLGTIQVWLRPNLDGTVSVFQSGSSTALGTTTAALSSGVYTHIELKVVIHGSAGTVDLKFDGISVLSLTGKNTAPNGVGWNGFQLGPNNLSSGAGNSMDYDDVFAADGTGSAWNTFKGDTRIDVRYPTANGATRNFTPSTGTDDYAVVDETTGNGDTDYLSTATATNKVSMVYQDLPVAGADIYGVQVCAYARKTDAGSAGHKALTRISGTDYLGTEVGLTSTYSIKCQCWDTSPATSTAWTESEFNAAEFGAQKSV